MEASDIKKRIEGVIMQRRKENPGVSGVDQPMVLQNIKNIELYFPNHLLEGHWMIFFKDSGYGGTIRNIVKRILRKVCWPFLKRQVIFNQAVYESLSSHHEFCKMLLVKLDEMESSFREGLKQTVLETLSLSDSYLGPKAKAELWFQQPVMIQYDEKGNATWAGTNERIIEKGWILRQLSREPLKSNILDLGCSESFLSIELASNGFKVTGIDVRPYPLRHPNFVFVNEDICKSTIDSNKYDIVIALSTVEHIGLDWYDKSDVNTSDFKAVSELLRLLKPGGILLLTVPFGERAQTSLHRIYDDESLHELLQYFNIDKIEYGIKMDDRTWIYPVCEEEAIKGKHDLVSFAPQAIALVRCSKPES